MTINEIEVKAQLLQKRYITEEMLKDETSKWRKFENEVDTLEKRIKKQAKEIVVLKSGTVTSHHSQKSWSNCSRQQQYNKKKKLASELTGIYSLFCWHQRGDLIETYKLLNAQCTHTECTYIHTVYMHTQFSHTCTHTHMHTHNYKSLHRRESERRLAFYSVCQRSVFYC